MKQDSMSSFIATLGYRAISAGIRVPPAAKVSAFIQHGRLMDLLRQLDVNLFIDVGANRGFYSLHVRQGGYTGALCSFEPMPDDHQHLLSFRKNDENWFPFNCALGSEPGVGQFFVYRSGEETTLSSFLETSEPYPDQQAIEVPIHRLDQVLKPILERIPEPRIFLKMDTQGFDLQVIEGASGILDKIVGLQSEISVFPLYKDMPHFTESLTRYEELGFGLIDLFVVGRLADGRVLEYDCMMARPEMLSRGLEKPSSTA